MILNLRKFKKIYLYRPCTDFRKGIWGLSSLVQDQMDLDPFSSYLFIFCNSKRNGLKILYWDKNGFALWYKRLEKEKFKWPTHLEGDSIAVNFKEVESFLYGLDPWQRPFKKLIYKKV
ncbi:MAG: IS66 family insertion sequence element accessory protein TnpB [Halobacteriovoraceae bacterium]|nr:IS66 family insertion sequence element accessory protein TnpB [Halobacteriovoraceae bacterium]